MATNQYRKTRTTLAENAIKKARLIRTIPNLPGKSEVVVNQNKKMSGPRVSTARKRKRQRMKSRQILKKCLGNKDASDPKLIQLPANLMVLSKQHKQGAGANRKSTEKVALKGTRKVNTVSVTNLPEDCTVQAKQRKSGLRVSTARKLRNQSIISGLIFKKRLANKPSNGLTSVDLPVDLEVMSKQHKSVVHAECHKSADKAAAKKKRGKKQSLAYTLTKDSKSYSAYTNQSVDSKVQSLKRKSGHRVSAVRKQKRQRMKSRQFLEKASTNKDASDLTLRDMTVDLKVLSNQQHKQAVADSKSTDNVGVKETTKAKTVPLESLSNDFTVQAKQRKAGPHVSASHKPQKPIVDAKSRKSADKAAAKKKRETKHSRSDTTAKATKSYAVFTNKPMDSKVRSLKRKKGRHVSSGINFTKTKGKTESPVLVTLSNKHPEEANCKSAGHGKDLDTKAEQMYSGTEIYHSGNVPRHMMSSFVLLEDICNVVPKKNSPMAEFQAELYVHPGWTKEWTTEHTETAADDRQNEFQKQNTEDGLGTSVLTGSEAFEELPCYSEVLTSVNQKRDTERIENSLPCYRKTGTGSYQPVGVNTIKNHPPCYSEVSKGNQTKVIETPEDNIANTFETSTCYIEILTGDEEENIEAINNNQNHCFEDPLCYSKGGNLTGGTETVEDNQTLFCEQSSNYTSMDSNYKRDIETVECSQSINHENTLIYNEVPMDRNWQSDIETIEYIQTNPFKKPACFNEVSMDSYQKTNIVTRENNQKQLSYQQTLPLRVNQSNLTGSEIDCLFTMISVVEQNRNKLSPVERRNFDKNVNYAYSILFGSVSNYRLMQVKKLNTVYGPHFVQGETNYCGYCCVSNALSEFSQELVTIEEMDTIADKLWLQMVNNPSLGLLTELEPMRDIEGFYSVEVLKFTLEAHKFQMNRINDSALIGLTPEESGRYVILSLKKTSGIEPLIIRERHHQHWITISFQGATPLLKDSQKTKAIPITIGQFGDMILNNLVSPGGVFFLSKDDDTAAKISAEEYTTATTSNKNGERIQQNKSASHLACDAEPSVLDKSLQKKRKKNCRTLRRTNRCPSQTHGESESFIEDTDFRQDDYDNTDSDPDYMESSSEMSESTSDDHYSSSEKSPDGNSRKRDTTEELSQTVNVTLHPKTSDVLSVTECTAGELDQSASTQHTEGLKVPTTKAYVDGKRVCDKIHHCCFCGKYYPRIWRHLKTHRDEEEVKAIKLATGKEKRKEQDRLRLRGDYMHNITVTNENQGILLVARRPTDGIGQYEPSDFLPCEHCKGYYVRWEVWRHQKKCKFAPSKDKKRKNRAQQNSVILMESSKVKPTWDKGFIENVIGRMNIDDVSMVVRNDMIALKLGELEFSNFAKCRQKKSSVRSNLRLLGRLVLQMRKDTGIRDGYLKDFLKVEHFDRLISAAHVLAALEETTDMARFKKPSVGQKVGRLLTKCCSVLEGQACRNNDENSEANARRMRVLIKNEWRYKVNAISHKTREENRRNKPVLLPTTEDLTKVKNYIEIELERAKNNLKSDQSMENFQALQSLVVCRLIMFNRHRSGEVSEVRLEDYLSRPNWQKGVNTEIYTYMPTLERRLMKSNDMIEVRGKRNPVYLILTPEVQQALELLMECRPIVGIFKENIYLFPRASGDGCIEGHKCLSDLLDNVEGLQYPDRICSTSMRKYIATVVQVMNLNDIEMEWLTNHLGHSVKIHKDFYRYQSPAIELGRVAKLLIAVDEGKTLGPMQDDEQFYDLCEDEDENEAEQQSERNIDQEVESETGDEEEESSTEDLAPSIIASNGIRKQKKKQCVRNPWTNEENQAIIRQFRDFIYFKRKPPNIRDCENARENETVLQSRPWKMIKWKVNNMIQTEKRKAQTYEPFVLKKQDEQDE